MLKEFDVGFVAVIYVQTGAGGVGRHIFFGSTGLVSSLHFSFNNFIGKFVLYTS